MFKGIFILIMVFASLTILGDHMPKINGTEYYKTTSGHAFARSISITNPNYVVYDFGHDLGNGSSVLVSDMINPIPFLPGNSVMTENEQQTSQRAIQNFPTGNITLLSTLLHTKKLLPNSTFMITPNPYTLKDSLIVTDNDRKIDSSHLDGVITLKNVRYSSYLINETHSPVGYGPVLLKARISVHVTAKDPVVVMENRNLSKPFIGPANVFAPYLNNSSFDTFISRGTTVGGKTITKVNDLPSTVIFNTLNGTQTYLERLNNTLLPQVNFKGSIAPSESTQNIFGVLKMPIYPAPVKGIASNITYMSPVFTINQRGLENNNFTLTPIIAKVFPGMVLLMNSNTGIASKLASLRSVQMQFEKNGTNIGLSFGISDTIPNSLKLPTAPASPLVMFMNIGYLGVESGTVPVNFSNSSFFKSSPAIHIIVSKLVPGPINRLSDGCPSIGLFSFNEVDKKWELSSKPVREPAFDRLNWCGYTLQTQHFSKFAVGGIKQSSSLVSER